ncbi:restriction modification system DNA specificity domain [Hymenobacter roseosalivarius DSM 11622]|uniref:Restriction modification system DNA specificity domain n=1 Tax=Hymenobacter roseosalivarius DSM 11622 TaxID=645990 RepID=A0A1W1VFJ1_9BACT|nr:restriction endonuclease subunit S [Hymenobacter roseosalivarius]SMB92122.1 restriction modification system DNA specificity domain [Hymenobacter roseosalivarius DSM 11622]
MKSGYKQTKIGEIPEEWEAVELIEALELQRGYDLPVQSRTKGEHPLIGSNGMIDMHNEWKVAGPTIVTGRSGTIGRLYYEEANCWPLNTTLYVKNTKGNDPKYLFYLLISIDLKRYGTGTGVPTLNRNVVHKHKIALPPLPEQQKIAEILSTVDEKMAVIDEQLAQTQELKKGLMQRLLTRGIGHTTFKDSPLGGIPESWSIIKLDDLVQVNRSITYGIVQPGPFDADGTFLVRGKDYSRGWVSPDDFFKVSKRVEEPYKRARLKKGDILITIVGAGLGNLAIVPDWLEGANITQTTARIAIDSERADSMFYYYVLQSPIGRENVRNYEKGNAQPGLNLADVKKFLVPALPLSEQRQIAQILTTVDAKLQVLTDKKAQYQELKRGLMQQLLTGQRRVRGAAEMAG